MTLRAHGTKLRQPWVRGSSFCGLGAPYAMPRTLGTRVVVPWAGGAIWDAANPGYADDANRARRGTGPMGFALAPATPE